MNDDQTTIQDLKLQVRQFSQARAWEQFHHPKDLALALVCEVGEVLEHFRYQTNEQISEKLASSSEQTADVTGVDLATSLQEKLVLADQKYPVEKAYGKPNKYTAYQNQNPT